MNQQAGRSVRVIIRKTNGCERKFVNPTKVNHLRLGEVDLGREHFLMPHTKGVKGIKFSDPVVVEAGEMSERITNVDLIEIQHWYPGSRGMFHIVKSSNKRLYGKTLVNPYDVQNNP